MFLNWVLNPVTEPDLRLQLLEPDLSAPIVHTLYGLLMLLPQSDAFHTLRRRLDCVVHVRPPAVGVAVAAAAAAAVPAAVDRRRVHVDQGVDFAVLTRHFADLQEKHRVHQLATRMAALSAPARRD